jgi:hypothetical protein
MENIKVKDIKVTTTEGVNVKEYNSEEATGQKDKMTFALYYQDGVAVDKYEFEVTKNETYDIINFADDTLEQAIWGAKIDMEKEEIRKWKKLNATNYRAKYPIPVNAMKSRFEKGKAMIIDFLANNHKKYEDDARIENELNEGEGFFK